MDKYTFEYLQDLPMRDLLEIKTIQSDRLARARQKKWDCIAAILFYQKEAENEENQ